MAKFNQGTKSIPTNTNMAGGVSYDRPIKKEVATVVLNSMLNGDSYYEKEGERLKRIETLITTSKSDAEFVAKAMVFTRTNGRLRSISHFMANILAENVKGSDFLRPALTKAIVRPDDMTEMLALWDTRNPNKMVPNSLRRAFKKALETKFDEYQFRKYAQPKSKVKLKDVVKLAHPSPKNFDDETIFKRVIEDQLKAVETAQTINASKTGEDRVKAYMKEIKSGKMGYMAALKNIRTLMESNISEDNLKHWSNFITDPKRVQKSMVLPFRFIDAWNAVRDLSIDEFKKNIVKKALERAFALSAGNTNIVSDDEKVAILLDESGSMGGYSSNDRKTPFYIGKVLSAAMKVGMNDDKCLFYTWADTCTRRDIKGLSSFDFINNLNTRGGGTDVSAPLKELIKTKTYVDKIVVFSDMQMYGSWGNIGDQLKNYLKTYRKEINPNVKVLFWNLEGYGGGSPLDIEKTSDIFEVAGFSDSMLQIIPKLWDDKDFLIKEIESIIL